MLHLVEISLIKKFTNRYFKNSIINLYITSIIKLSENNTKYNCQYQIELFIITKNINNNKILEIKYANNNKSKFEKTINLDKSFRLFSILNILLLQISSNKERAL